MKWPFVSRARHERDVWGAERVVRDQIKELEQLRGLMREEEEAHAATRAELERVGNREAHLATRLVDAVRLLDEQRKEARHLLTRIRANLLDGPRGFAYRELCVSSRQLIADSGIAEHLGEPLPADLVIEPDFDEEAPGG